MWHNYKGQKLPIDFSSFDEVARNNTEHTEFYFIFNTQLFQQYRYQQNSELGNP